MERGTLKNSADKICKITRGPLGSRWFGATRWVSLQNLRMGASQNYEPCGFLLRSSSLSPTTTSCRRTGLGITMSPRDPNSPM